MGDSKDTEGVRIAYLFADHGVESEALSTYGRVERYTINPRENAFVDETVQMDLMEEMPPEGADLAVLHPMCTKWSDMPNVDPDGHEDQIPRAREIAQVVAEDYVIENKPRAPLEDPIVLDGRMFGLPIKYERAFETSFPVEQPPRQSTITDQVETSPFFYSERTHAWWKAVKGIRGDYPKEHVAKNALPLVYVDYLCRAWLEATGRAQGVADYSDYDAEMDQRRAELANENLGDFA